MNKKLVFVLAAAVAVGVVCVLLFCNSAREGTRRTETRRAPASGARDAAREGTRRTETRRAPASGARDAAREGTRRTETRRAPASGAQTPAKAKSPRLNAWAAALGTNRLAAAERLLKQQKVEREMTEAEQKLAEFAHDIASASDAKAARRFAGEQLNAEHPKVREAAVFALANCGTPCLAELTPYMADADEGVRTEAVSAWQSAWFEMPESSLKAETAVAVMCVLNDEAALEPIAAELMKFKRETAEDALGVALEQGTAAGKAAAERVCEALGIE